MPHGSSRTPFIVLAMALVAGCAVAVVVGTLLRKSAAADPYSAGGLDPLALPRSAGFFLGIIGIIIGAKIALGGWQFGTSAYEPEEWWTQTGRRVSRFVIGLAMVVFFVPVFVAALLL